MPPENGVRWVSTPRPSRAYERGGTFCLQPCGVIPGNDPLTSVAELGASTDACCARSVVEGLCCNSDRLEPRDQLVELVRAENVVGRCRQLLDVFPSPCSLPRAGRSRMRRDDD